MAPLEQIIWEAKLKPGTLKDTRRPSTTVDETGCVITKGFVIPSRSSSIDSTTRSSFSSFETPGTPVSPVDEAPPGFPVPTAALCSAPELHTLKTRSPTALCRTSKSDGNLTSHVTRPPLGDRRRTWQVDRVASSVSHLRRGSSSRWNDDELAEVTCQPDPPDGQRGGMGILMQAHAHPGAPNQNKGHVRRVKPAQVRLGQLQFQNCKPKQRQKAPKSVHKSNKVGDAKETQVKETSTADAAIASDSEDDFLSDDDQRALTGKIAIPNYANYAERRARADGKAAQYQRSAGLDPPPASPSENAIETDDEDGDITASKCDRKISARLSLAQVHCTQNALATKLYPGQLPTRHKSPLSVSIAPTALNKLTVEGQSISSGDTPANLKTFEPDAYVANRELRPSRSQPRPAKGVLKNTQPTET